MRQLKTENSGVMEVVELSYSISDVVDKALEKADSVRLLFGLKFHVAIKL